MPRKPFKKRQPAAEAPAAVESTQPVSTPDLLNAAAEGLHEFNTDGDLVDIWERRMLNPSTKPSRPIRLTTPGMHIRWINLAANGRYQRARYEEGWVPVSKSELKDEREIYGVSYTTESWVCRGEKQQEMLMKIPEAVWRRIQQAKYNDVMKSRRSIKENMQAQGAKHFGEKYNSNRGDEIADSMSAFKGDIRFGTEQVNPDEEDLAVVQAGLGE